MFYVRLEKQNLYNERLDNDAILVLTAITMDIVSYTIKSSAIKNLRSQVDETSPRGHSLQNTTSLSLE